MTVLPIVVRELRLSSRKGATYWGRVSLPLVVIIFSCLIFLPESGRTPPQMMGRSLFMMITWVCFVFCALMGVRLTADAISREKRDDTLGLLFLTPLRGYDVVLGKLLGSSVLGVNALVAALPALGIPLLLGGVPPLTAVMVALVLLSTMLLSLSVGMFCSAIFKDGRNSAGFTFLIMLSFCGLVPLAYGIALGHFRVQGMGPPQWVESLRLLSPSLTCYAASMGLVGGFNPWTTGISVNWMVIYSVLVQSFISLALLAVACKLVTRVWQVGTAVRFATLRKFWQWLCFGPPNFRRWLRQHWLEINPVAWLSLRAWLKMPAVWILPVAFLGLMVYLRINLGRNFYDLNLAMVLSFLLLGGLKFALAIEAGQVFARDLRSGALELMLTTPMTVAEILAGHLRALRALLIKPVLASLALVLLLMIVGVFLGRDAVGINRVGYTLAFLGGIGIFLLDLRALAWMGIWAAVTAKSPNQVGSTTAVRVLLLPWIFIYGSLGFLALLILVLGSRRFFELPFAGMYLLWFCSSIINSLFWAQYARQRLTKEFRVRALQHYDPDGIHGFWPELGRWLGRLWAGKAPWP